MASSIGSLSGTTSSSIYGLNKRNGISGLASGLDTDSLVEQMTSGTRAKISKQLQNKQTLSWKSDAYRSVSDKLVQLSQNYMSYSSSANLYSESFYARNLITASGVNSKYVEASGTSSSVDELSILGVKQMAKDTNLLTNVNASDRALTTDEFDFLSDDTNGKLVSSLAGQTIAVKYGTKTYSVTLDEDSFYNADGTLVADGDNGKTIEQTIADAFNKSLKNVKFDSSTTMDSKIEMKVNADGKLELGSAGGTSDGNSLYIRDATGDTLSTLGFTKNSTTSTGVDDTKLSKRIGFKEAIAESSMVFSYNGLSKSITMPTGEEMDEFGKNGKTFMEDFVDNVQKKLDTAFGTGRVKAEFTGGTGSSVGKLKFTTTNPKTGADDATSVLKITSGTGNNVMGEHGVLGIPFGESNRLNLNTKIKNAGINENLLTNADGTYSITINGVKIDHKTVNGTEVAFDENTTLQEVIDAVNASDAKVKMSYMETSDRFSIMSTESGVSGKIDIEDSGLGKIFFNASNVNLTQGQDAIISVKYGDDAPIEISRGSNAFNLDGLNVTVKNTFGYKDDGSGNQILDTTSEAITFTAKADTEKISTAIKDMVKDFNEIIKLANDLASTKKDRNYAPLTAEQKEGMSEDEIKNWEEKAKQGILFNDMDLRGFTDEIRFLFSGDTQTISRLEAAGISVSSDNKDNGKIIVDEEKLNAALEKNPNEIMELFTADSVKADSNGEGGQKGGVMNQMKTVFDKYAGTEGSTKGVFIEKAGSQYSPLSLLSNSLLNQMNDIDDIVEDLKDKLQTETDRYYNKFTNLETYISQMNSQSDWLSQQLGSN